MTYDDYKETVKKSVKKYQDHTSTICLRFMIHDASGTDIKKFIKDRAKEKGFIISRGQDVGQGNINAYIIDLIEKDTGLKIPQSIKVEHN